MDLLKVEDLNIEFVSDRGTAKITNNLNFELKKSETLGVVGESGSGKSVTSKAIMGLLEIPKENISGHIYFKGKDLLNKTEKELSSLRGNKISMIFQEPMTALNPVFTIGNQLIETITLHQKVSKKKAREIAIEMLKLINIPIPEKRLKQYPHELSGGMRQRVLIAMALSCKPDLLIADEPTTALDVTIQAQILDIIKKLKKELSMSIIMISHDLGVISEVADKVIVMYAGNIVEYGKMDELFEKPLHPYTRGLIDSMPSLEMDQEELNTIEGMVPSNYNLPTGCKFHTRCPFKKKICEKKNPDLVNVANRKVKCWKYTEEWYQNDD